jgi:hypothetical protein
MFIYLNVQILLIYFSSCVSFLSLFSTFSAFYILLVFVLLQYSTPCLVIALQKYLYTAISYECSEFF